MIGECECSYSVCEECTLLLSIRREVEEKNDSDGVMWK